MSGGWPGDELWDVSPAALLFSREGGSPVWVPAFAGKQFELGPRYSHFACLNFTYSAAQTTPITASTTKYPYSVFSSGMFSKFMP